MRTFIGTGQGSPKDAVKKATQGLNNPSAILFMAPYEMMEEVLPLLRVKSANWTKKRKKRQKR